MAPERKLSKSSFFRKLQLTRIIVDPYELCTGLPAYTSYKTVGLLFKLMPSMIEGRLPSDFEHLSRIANVSVDVLERAWPGLETFLEKTADGGWSLKPANWFHIQTVSAQRTQLRHLLKRLAEYWGNACVYCGQEAGELEIEHIVPRKRGGTDDITNLTLACKGCNSKKRTKTAAEFGHPTVHERAARIQ